ncbi:PocR sensory domain-containing protein [Verrucomicrobium sp. GAS474]|uniref:helix-turn-helix transcriptional regulator n=1 Tax=Verrucomicrobium sp. GAS474 TaxID=1882831 RepID=UPI00087C3A6D|nr:helix-turn-helix domain-containing protein [Verrucomicrobium sp. GAS474]SDT89027.1 PocR sensory domain-containing protein [Verrucomicrobium sp. GAS474]
MISPSKPAPPPPSLLERLLALLGATGPLRICFDDLSGITVDYPELTLPVARQIHDCDHCQLAKSSVHWSFDGRYADCTMNKRATNRIALRRQTGFHGLCHLGLLDLVEPVIHHGVLLGVLYYGQVSVREWRKKSLARIARHCQRKQIDPAPLLATFERVPVITRAEIGTHRERLRTMAETIHLLCESLAVPVERYRIDYESVTWRILAQKPSLVRLVGEHVSRHYGEPCRVSDLARRFQCHPNYLGALFGKSVGMSLNDYVNRVRIERAKHLLRVDRFGISEVGYKCGFSDPSRFGKTFRQHEGMSPLTYRRTFEKDQTPV